MSHAHSTTKHRTFKHLNAFRCGQIEAMLHLGIPKVKIAKDLGIARSTLYAEIKRGTARQMHSDWTYYDQYFAETGQIIYERHRKNSGKPSKFAAAQDFIKHAETYILGHGYAPDAICGPAGRTNLFTVQVCTKTIHSYIAKGLLKVKNIDLRQKVRRKHKEKKSNTNSRTLGERIDLRDPLVDERSAFGNGSAFARLQEAIPEAKVYYAHPYAPWERGTNEKQNALVRYFIPKGADMTNLSEEELQRVEDWVDTLPRKILGYETPQERFDAALKIFAHNFGSVMRYCPI